ncbi:hypothetical protein [Christiangramia aquimixticola]|uniref:hypothetical protein n=1 Tax=Christiangramia aquimixticola TaxID=1697558 RepID=UPI003AA9B00A
MKDFETLDYKHVQFTGNEEDLFILDQINFNEEATCIFYKEYQLNNKTTITELIKIFGESYFKDLKNNSGDVVIPNKNKTSEDGYQFELRNRKLISITYWSPC